MKVMDTNGNIVLETEHNPIGEGAVFSFLYKKVLYQFKVKGDRHAGKSKVKTLKKVDNERLQKINDVAQEVSRVWRLDQMFTEANDLNNGGTPDMRNMGTFMKLVNKDIIKEESDTIRAAGLEPKEIFKTVSVINREFFVAKMEELTFG